MCGTKVRDFSLDAAVHGNILQRAIPREECRAVVFHAAYDEGRPLGRFALFDPHPVALVQLGQEVHLDLTAGDAQGGLVRNAVEDPLRVFDVVYVASMSLKATRYSRSSSVCWGWRMRAARGTSRERSARIRYSG